MATIIQPGDGRAWEQVFPEVESDQQASANLNGALMLMAAFMSRGGHSAAVAVNRIVRADVSVTKVNDPPEMWADLGHRVYYLVKIAATKPVVRREP